MPLINNLAMIPRPPSTRAFTLTEMMISLSVFSLVVLGMVYVNIFGMQQDGLVNSKLGASSAARRGFEQLLQEIRGANTLLIGSGTETTFRPIPDGAAQQGTALQICPGTNATQFIQYYLDTNSASLRRTTNGGSSYEVIIDHLTNTALIFQAMDAFTNVLMMSPTGYVSHYTVRTIFQVSQYEYPITPVGDGAYYDYYQLQFKATRRNR